MLIIIAAASEPGYIYSEEGVVSYGNRKGNCGGEAAEMEVDRRSVQLFGTDGKESVTLATNETSIIFGHPLERKEKSELHFFLCPQESSSAAKRGTMPRPASEFLNISLLIAWYCLR